MLCAVCRMLYVNINVHYLPYKVGIGEGWSGSRITSGWISLWEQETGFS